MAVSLKTCVFCESLKVSGIFVACSVSSNFGFWHRCFQFALCGHFFWICVGLIARVRQPCVPQKSAKCHSTCLQSMLPRATNLLRNALPNKEILSASRERYAACTTSIGQGSSQLAAGIAGISTCLTKTMRCFTNLQVRSHFRFCLLNILCEPTFFAINVPRVLMDFLINNLSVAEILYLKARFQVDFTAKSEPKALRATFRKRRNRGLQSSLAYSENLQAGAQAKATERAKNDSAVVIGQSPIVSSQSAIFTGQLAICSGPIFEDVGARF